MEVFALPAIWLTDALGLPINLGYLSFYLANAFLLVTLVLAWRVFATWWHSRHIFYLFLYVYLLLFGIIGYQATVQIGFFWIYSVLWVLVALIITFRLQQKKPLAKEAARMFTGFTVIGAIICIALPASYAAYHVTLQNHIDLTLSAQAAKQRTNLVDLSEVTRAKVQELALDAEIVAKVRAAEFESLPIFLQNKMVDKELQFITITDIYGEVLARAAKPGVVGDNIFEKSSWSVPLYVTETPVYGIAYNEVGIPTIVAAEPILSSSSPIAYILAGRFINQDYITASGKKEGINLAVVSENGTVIAYSPDTTLAAALQSSDFSNQLSELSTANGNLGAKVDTGEASYILHAISLATLNPQQGLVIATADIDPNPEMINRIGNSIGIVGIGLLLVWLTLRRLARRPTKSHA